MAHQSARSPRTGGGRSTRSGSTRLFLTCVPGLAPLVSQHATTAEVAVTDSGFDGRSDVLLLDAGRGRRAAVLSLSTAEDVFVEVGRAARSEGDNPRSIAAQTWRPDDVQRALSIWAAEVRPLAASMTFRLIVRVRSERAFLRTDLRREMTRVIGAERPKWRLDDPGQVEVWVSEYRPGQFVAGLRLTDVRMRQHAAREVERPGALRPTVAAAMVALAGEPRGTLLDPCCGSGTILAEAAARGWTAAGGDLDPSAVDVTRTNVPDADLRLGDARDLDYADGSVAACVSNLPFGRQYAFQGDLNAWLHRVLSELARVTQVGGRVVVLSPRMPTSGVPTDLRLSADYPIRLLGTKTTIWAYDRI